MPYSFAATRPVNPPGAEPVLTEEQVWKGLEYKAHDPVPFVPMIASSKTIFEEGNKLTREMTMANSNITMKEDIETHAPTIVYFEMSTGLRITNTISYGPADELLLTYSFANGIPGVAADKPKPSGKELNAIVDNALDRSLKFIREMVKEGKF
ncbi:hypothetical protein MVEN_01336100 [Mycena venus]|uniref:DUF1857-domain-containing protein n=1 Tax=Mycena venus TaxID=2733690 RepID=A0A8H6Y1X2_9AGAR|nr:hypothetical protein MVEN_01336100 [Mycena venus]